MRRGIGGFLAGIVSILSATAPVVAAEALVKPRLVDSVEARYPEGAHGDAEVVLSVLIAEDGRVTEVEARSGDAPFEAAMATTRRILNPKTG